MSFTETVKSPADVDKEGAILTEMLEIVEQKDSLRSMLEEDRQRWAVFLNLIDLAQSSLEDDVFAPDDSVGEHEKSDESYGACQSYSEQIPPALQPASSRDDDPEAIDSDLEIEEEFDHLFSNDHSDTSPHSDSMNDLFFGSDVEIGPNFESPPVEQTNTRPPKIVWSPSVEFEGQIVELKDLVSHEELEMWSAREPVEDNHVEITSRTDIEFEDSIDEQEVEEFDQLVQDLSDDGSVSLGSSSIGETCPNSVEFDGQPTELASLVSQGDPGSRNDDSGPSSDCERPVSSIGSDYFYERRQAADVNKMRKTSQILKEKVQVYDELDRKSRKHVETVEEEQDWGSLGVKFTNRGVVRDLVWMWEYNHLQQSGRLGVYPEERPVKKKKKIREGSGSDRASGSQNDLESNEDQEQTQRTRTKKRLKIKPEMESETQAICQSDVGWAWWQIGILFWLTVFSFFILSSLPANNSWPF